MRDAAARFASDLAGIHSIGCVEGRFAGLLGEPEVRLVRSADPAGFERPAWHALRNAFREGLAPLYESGAAWAHSLRKPYGYPGDFGILEAVYDRGHCATPPGPGAFLDAWGLDMTLPKAVRARKDALRTWLEGTATAEATHVLSIAAGSARELRDLPPASVQRLKIVLADQEPRSMGLAEATLRSRPYPVDIRAVRCDVVTGAGTEPVLQSAPFDIIYSFRLFDYLKDDLLLSCASRFTPLLADGGRFVFALKDHRYYDAWFYDWFFDWRFVPRTLDDGPRIAEALGLRVTQTLVLESRTIGIFVCQR